jgi:alkylation response protein AidB-like acyl-CoA dehydrogenase
MTSQADQPGRSDLVAWREFRPSNYYDADPNLARVLDRWTGPDAREKMEPSLREFGAAVATVVEPAVVTLEAHREFPVHIPFDAVGRPAEAIEFHPAYEVAGQAIWSSGMLAGGSERPSPYELTALFYLLAHCGEGGHACPVVCTAGAIRALEQRASGALQEQFLPALHARDYGAAMRASQFLTEIQGGSDVGANVVRALPDEDIEGAWRISGEKWFCSVADAGLFVMTARPDGATSGTKGLGCFAVPRLLPDGTPNGFRIRRLKDKLGTRAMASAEIDFDGALGWPIGPLDEGFHVAVEELLNTSRWLNAVGSTGIMHRAYLEAASFARHRTAFGQPISGFPLVREQLALMKAEGYAALSSTMALASLLARMEEGNASAVIAGAYRLLVNANKYLTSVEASEVARRGIEVLGGNGTIEDFSPLPRLYRDAMVFESWEGTHNVLCAQVLRDCVRFGVLDALLAWLRDELEPSYRGHADGVLVMSALEILEPRLRRSLEDPAGHGALHFRRQLETLVRVVQAACLLTEIESERARAGSKGVTTAGTVGAAGRVTAADKAAVASLFVRQHLVPGYQPEDDPGWLHLVDRALGDDVDTLP